MKLCPFCGKKGKLSYRQIRFIGQNDFGNKKIRIGSQVICNRCKARGPLYCGEVIDPTVRRMHNKQESFLQITQSAIDAWNRRANE